MRVELARFPDRKHPRLEIRSARTHPSAPAVSLLPLGSVSAPQFRLEAKGGRMRNPCEGRAGPSLFSQIEQGKDEATIRRFSRNIRLLRAVGLDPQRRLIIYFYFLSPRSPPFKKRDLRTASWERIGQRVCLSVRPSPHEIKSARTCSSAPSVALLSPGSISAPRTRPEARGKPSD